MNKIYKGGVILLSAAILASSAMPAQAGWFLRKIQEKLTEKSGLKLSINPPEQPRSGPGGSDYIYSKIESENYLRGTGLEYWVFKPANPLPNAEFPVVVFNHGWEGDDPKYYEAWIDHIAKKGNIVIFPRYQATSITTQDRFTPNAIIATKLALERLKKDSKIKPDLSKFAILGHSVGAIVSVNMAALAKSEGLPQPKAIMCVEPGATWLNSKMEDLRKIPQETLLLSVVGDKDDFILGIAAKKIISDTLNISTRDKNLITMISDDYGKPELVADHFSPCGSLREKITQLLSNSDSWKSVDAIDYGLWKLFDGLYSAAFYGINRQYALGNTPQQKSMGIWSDGTPVKEMKIE